jgi:hypothetical protein
MTMNKWRNKKLTNIKFVNRLSGKLKMGDNLDLKSNAKQPDASAAKPSIQTKQFIANDLYI